MTKSNHDEDFLKNLYVDLQNEMRWRREVEYKLLGNFILVVSFLVSSQAIVYQKIEDAVNRLFISIALCVFLLILTILLNIKINSENAIYKNLGGYVVKIWEHYRLFEKLDTSGPFLNDKSKNYGMGEGFRKTISIFWILWVSFTFFSILLAVFYPSSST